MHSIKTLLLDADVDTKNLSIDDVYNKMFRPNPVLHYADENDDISVLLEGSIGLSESDLSECIFNDDKYEALAAYILDAIMSGNQEKHTVLSNFCIDIYDISASETHGIQIMHQNNLAYFQIDGLQTLILEEKYANIGKYILVVLKPKSYYSSFHDFMINSNEAILDFKNKFRNELENLQ